MLESEAVSTGWIESRKMKNKFADGLLGTLECNDMSRLLKISHRLPEKSGPVILKCLQPHISMCTCKWSYFKALYHSIHDDVPLSIWGRIVNKTPGQNTHEETLQADLLKKFHWKIFIRLSAIIYKPVQGWLSLNESQCISPVKKNRMFIVHFKIHCQRLTPNNTHSMWYYIVSKKVFVTSLI